MDWYFLSWFHKALLIERIYGCESHSRNFFDKTNACMCCDIAFDAGPRYSFLLYDNENLIISAKAVAFKDGDLGVKDGVELDLANIRFFASYVVGLSNINNIDARYKWYSRQALLGFNFNLL